MAYLHTTLVNELSSAHSNSIDKDQYAAAKPSQVKSSKYKHMTDFEYDTTQLNKLMFYHFSI